MNHTHNLNKEHLLQQPVELRNRQDEVYFILKKEKKYIRARWQGHVTADDVVEAGKAYLQFVGAHPCSGLLNDNSEGTGGWEEANNWFEFEWMPAAVAAGLRCMAHIHSLSVISNFSEQDLFARVSLTIRLAEFTTSEAAVNWLKQCK